MRAVMRNVRRVTRCPLRPNPGGCASQALQLQRWRTLTPLLYDWLASTNRTWPSLTCRWGPPAIAFNASAAGGTRSRQRLYWSEQTDGSAPNTLIAASVDVILPRCAPAESVARACTEAGAGSTFRKGKTVYHPGEVNKIREVNGVAPAELVVTHSDVKEVYVWNLGAQADRCGDTRHEPSRPDCTLTGHTLVAEFALATASASPAVASGGKDTSVCLWHLRDGESSLLEAAHAADGGAGAAASGRTSLNSGGLGGLSNTVAPAPALACRSRFMGHSDTVEDIAFHPTSDQQLCSVGDDSALCFWDARTGTSPVIKARPARCACIVVACCLGDVARPPSLAC
jgi:histone-binding protein RBBP4